MQTKKTNICWFLLLVYEDSLIIGNGTSLGFGLKACFFINRMINQYIEKIINHEENNRVDWGESGLRIVIPFSLFTGRYPQKQQHQWAFVILVKLGDCFLRFLTHYFPRLHHIAAGGDHGVSNLLPSLAVLHRAAVDMKEKGKETQKVHKPCMRALRSPPCLLVWHCRNSSTFPGNKPHKSAIAKCCANLLGRIM